MQNSSPKNTTPAAVRQDFADGLRLNLDLGVAKYPVFLSEKPALLMAKYLETLIGKQIGEKHKLRFNEPKRMVVLCDENTAELFGIDIESQLITAGWQVDALTVPAGESAKTMAAAEQICEALTALGATRDTVLCSLGGGVISDLAGFVAGIYKRGMHLVHISTSLVGLVDAAVGGKTAVNTASGKNLIGLYKHPLVIVSDPSYLQTLPDEEYACGLAEAAKTAILAGGDFTAWLEANTEALQSRDPSTLRELIARCISFKAGIVAADPTEDMVPSVRLSLNYGHTLGHVIETVTAQRAATDEQAPPPIPHGIAVAQGMRFEARMAMQLVGADADFVLRQDALLDALGLPPLDPSIMGDDSQTMMDIFYRDKKTLDSDLRFILMPAVGQAEIVTVSQTILHEHLQAWLAKHTRCPDSASSPHASTEHVGDYAYQPKHEPLLDSDHLERSDDNEKGSQ